MSSVKTTLGKLRLIQLPKKPADGNEADHLVALRNTLEFHAGIGDAHRLVVPSTIAELIPADKVEPTTPPK